MSRGRLSDIKVLCIRGWGSRRGCIERFSYRTCRDLKGTNRIGSRMTSNIPLQQQSSAFGFRLRWDVCIFSKIVDDADDDENGLNGFFLYKEVPEVVRRELKMLKHKIKELLHRPE